MLTTAIFDQYVREYEQWYEDHPEVYRSEIEEVREHLVNLPENLRGIEVGVGTGRFSVPLGIKEGVEPSKPMADIAIKRGVEIMHAVGERLPYGDLQFDFVLFVTVCHLDSVKASLLEAKRVLRRNGSIIVGFLDKELPIAQEYLARGKKSKFFAQARFYRAITIEKMLKECGFADIVFNQTLFGNLEDINQVQTSRPGHGEGSFVVARALKK